MMWEQRVTWGHGGVGFDLTFIKSNGKTAMRMLHKTVMLVFKIIVKNWNGDRRVAEMILGLRKC